MHVTGLRYALIDGFAGVGKTSLAQLTSARSAQIRVVHMDDLTHGWHDLAGATERLAELLNTGRTTTFDWQRMRAGELLEVDAARPLLIEGCGSITASTVAGAVASVWVVLDDDERMRRALHRDGDLFAPHLADWTRQERLHLRANRPDQLAAQVVVGKPATLAECSLLLYSSLVVEAT